MERQTSACPQTATKLPEIQLLHAFVSRQTAMYLVKDLLVFDSEHFRRLYSYWRRRNRIVRSEYGVNLKRAASPKRDVVRANSRLGSFQR